VGSHTLALTLHNQDRVRDLSQDLTLHHYHHHYSVMGVMLVMIVMLVMLVMLVVC